MWKSVKTVRAHLPDTNSGVGAGNKKNRKVSYLLVCLLGLTFAVLGVCWYASHNISRNASSLQRIQIVEPQSEDNTSILRKVHFPAGDLGQAVRFNASQILARLIKQGNSFPLQTPHHIHFLQMQACVITLLIAILYSFDFSLNTNHTLYHLQTVLGRALPVRAGPRN